MDKPQLIPIPNYSQEHAVSVPLTLTLWVLERGRRIAGQFGRIVSGQRGGGSGGQRSCRPTPSKAARGGAWHGEEVLGDLGDCPSHTHSPENTGKHPKTT